MRRLRRNVVSVITSENYHELVALAQYLRENADVDGHYFEVVRGEIPDPKLKALTSEVFDLKPTSTILRDSVKSGRWRRFRNC
jgi:hypothetical protein